MVKRKASNVRRLDAPADSVGPQSLQELQAALRKTREALASATVTASVADGAVTVVMSGQQHCQSVDIAPHLLAPGNRGMLQELVAAAVNQAIEQSQMLAAERLGPIGAPRP